MQLGFLKEVRKMLRLEGDLKKKKPTSLNNIYIWEVIICPTVEMGEDYKQESKYVE